MRTLIMLAALVATGCTSTATRYAIRDYEDSADYKRLAFNNAYRIANEQMTLNLTTFLKAHAGDVDLTLQAVKATTEARRQLEEVRRQFELADTFASVTVRQYLYDQQGPINVWIESMGKELGKNGEAAVKAKDVSGLRLKDLVPKVDTTSPAPTGGDRLGRLLDDGLKTLNGK